MLRGELMSIDTRFDRNINVLEWSALISIQLPSPYTQNKPIQSRHLLSSSLEWPAFDSDQIREAPDDDAEWHELDQRAMSSERFKSLANHLKSSGQALA
jgi:hypothetical protein